MTDMIVALGAETDTRHVFIEPSLRPVRPRAERLAMSPDDVAALLARNTMASVTVELDDARPRTSRARYAYTASALYFPAWTHPESFYRTPPVVAACDISEVDGLRVWSYVWLCGLVTPLQPTGGTAERDAWRHGIGQLRRVIPNLGPTEELAFANFAVFQVEILTLEGVVLRMT